VALDDIRLVTMLCLSFIMIHVGYEFELDRTRLGTLALHVLAVTVLANLGKMFPLLYRREAHWRERLALCIGMWPRGDVGAGVLVISIGYGIGGPLLTVATLSLALNLLLTGAFIWAAKRLLRSVTSPSTA
jgi:Kef-type K+ transport system membrane component KefB